MEKQKNEPPKRLRKEHRRCTQSQCGHYTNGECKSCADCKARPFELKNDCDRCHRCENVPGALRWGDPNTEMEAQKQGVSEEQMIEAMIRALQEKLEAVRAGREANNQPKPQGEINVRVVEDARKKTNYIG